MAFTSKQARALKAKLDHKHVKSRVSNGTPIAYVEGWHVIAEANRIFGYDCWDRTTLSPTCVWTELQRGQTVCFYSTRVRIRVRAGDSSVMRDGIGTGIGRSSSPEQAHEIALKAAETDATKRALATFGNPFGLALYDKEQAGVAKPHSGKGSDQPTTSAGYALAIPGGTTTTYSGSSQFIAAALAEIPKMATLDALYAFWEANVASLTQLRRHAGSEHEDPVAGIIAALKERARQFGKGAEIDHQQARRVELQPATRSESAGLAFPKERRVRDKSHLAYVAEHPCIICGRHPVHAHHLRFAQPRAMAMKVSDEYTVPLCAIHHDELHRTGDERAWWARHGIIEPLKLAAKLWGASQRGSPAPIPLEAPEPPTTQSASPEASTAAE